MPTDAKPGVDIFAQRLAEDPYAPRVPDWGRGQSSSVSMGLSCLVLSCLMQPWVYSFVLTCVCRVSCDGVLCYVCLVLSYRVVRVVSMRCGVVSCLDLT
jgi:hypothetical protein